MNQPIANWLLYNGGLLSSIFGPHNIIIDDIGWSWVQIENFYLPRNWSRFQTRLLIVLPEGTRLFLGPPDRFYLDPGLTTIDGKIPPHYYENETFNDLRLQGWARYSFHIEGGWKPMMDGSGTTLVHALDGLYDMMQEAAEGA
jgi:hypothetical protein